MLKYPVTITIRASNPAAQAIGQIIQRALNREEFQVETPFDDLTDADAESALDDLYKRLSDGDEPVKILVEDVEGA